MNGEVNETLQACAEGTMSSNVALMRVFLASADEAVAREALDSAIAGTGADVRAAGRLRAMSRLWDEVPAAFGTVKKMTALGESRGAMWGSIFDAAACISPEAAVALYSLGNGDLLDKITGELVQCMQGWGLLEPRHSVLDLGCGTGRIAAAIAPFVRQVVAADVSAEMVRLAAKKTGPSGNVAILQVDGSDLAFLADETIDLVLAIDSFPYVVRSGCAARYVGEAARILRPGGRFLIMNFSYRGNLDGDRREVAGLAREHGFTVLRNGTIDLSLWDGQAFLFAKRSDHAARIPDCT